MLTADDKRLSGAVSEFENKISGYGDYITEEELIELKDDVKELVQQAISKGITIELQGTKLLTDVAVDKALKMYSDADELIKDIREAISKLSTVSKKDQIIAEENKRIADEKAAAEAARLAELEKTFNSISGDAYKINTGLIDFTILPHNYAGNEEYSIKGNHKDGAKPEAHATIQKLKDQVKAQITKMLEEKGLSFDRIAGAFENVWNNAEAGAVEECVGGRNGNLFRKSKSWFSTKTLIDNFIAKFNAGIKDAIEAMKDPSVFSTADIDYTVAGKDENGNEEKLVTDEYFDADLPTLYASGATVECKGLELEAKGGSKYYYETATKMADRMRTQFHAKAVAMCIANGIIKEASEFDESTFETIFNNARDAGVAASVTSRHATWFRSEKATFNAKTLLDTLTNQFKENYTNYVNGEKAKKPAETAE